MAMEKMVKGSIIMDLIRIIRGTKDERLIRYFTEEQKKILSENIIPSGWYPVDLHRQSLLAIYEVFGQKKPETAREWGKTFGEKIIAQSYKSLINPGDPRGTLKNFSRVSKTFFNYDYLEVVASEEKKVQFRTLFENSPAAIAFSYLLAGWLEKMVELSGGLAPKVEVSLPRPGTGQATGFVITWD